MLLREYLKERREYLGLKQSDVAKMLGVKNNTYCQIELGERQQKMKVDTLLRLSEALRIPTSKMLEYERNI